MSNISINSILTAFEVGTISIHRFTDELTGAMAPLSSTLAWKIPWTEEPGGLQSMGWQGVGHD